MTAKVINSILPKDIGRIKSHFQRELAKAEKKLNNVNRTKRELEMEIETLKDGIGWCENVYKVSKRNGSE